MNKRAKAAGVKAAATRRARNSFKNIYGEQTLRAVRQIITGQKTKKDLESPFSKRQLAAYKANLTRGNYRPFVYFSPFSLYIEGDCNY